MTIVSRYIANPRNGATTIDNHGFAIEINGTAASAAM
jgi:hypothetical protein